MSGNYTRICCWNKVHGVKDPHAALRMACLPQESKHPDRGAPYYSTARGSTKTVCAIDKTRLTRLAMDFLQCLGVCNATSCPLRLFKASSRLQPAWCCAVEFPIRLDMSLSLHRTPSRPSSRLIPLRHERHPNTLSPHTIKSSHIHQLSPAS